MFEREMMIQGLRKQRQILQDLIVELEQRPAVQIPELNATSERVHLVSRNLKKLRKIKSSYLDYLDSASLS